MLNCGVRSLFARDEETHRLNDCELRLIVCTCKMVMPARDRSDHMIAECTNKPTLCPQGCGKTVARDEMDFHIENLCEKKGTYFSRKIFCPVGCGLRLMRRDVIEHVSYYCKRRLTDCPYRCGQSVQFDKLRTHLFFCPKRCVCVCVCVRVCACVCICPLYAPIPPSPILTISHQLSNMLSHSLTHSRTHSHTPRPICCEPGAKSCTKVFFKWFYCDINPGDPGGVGYDGTAPDGTVLHPVGQEMLQLFDQSGAGSTDLKSVADLPYEGGHNDTGSIGDVSQLDGDESVGGGGNRENVIEIDGDGMGLKAAHTPGGTRHGTATRAPFSQGDGAGCKTPLPRGAPIYYDGGSIFFHGALRMKSCKRHQATVRVCVCASSDLSHTLTSHSPPSLSLSFSLSLTHTHAGAHECST